MKSIRTEPHNHAPEGDERIRTAVTAPGADPVYEPEPWSSHQFGACVRCGVNDDPPAIGPSGLCAFCFLSRYERGAAS